MTTKEQLHAEFKSSPEGRIRVIYNNTVQIQFVGKALGKPVSELQIGDAVLWNGGTSTAVTGFGKETKAYIVVEFGNHARRMKKSRIVAMAGWGVVH